MKKPLSPRALAWQSLIKCDKNGRYTNLELDAVLKKSDLSAKDRNLYTTLFYGVTERRITLDHLISCYSTRPLSSLSSSVANLLRLGLYQICFLTKIPESAAVNESVALIKTTGESAAAPFINAVLRNACREKKNGIPFPANLSDEKRLSVEYSYPLWMVELWLRSYGEERARSIMEEQNKRAPLTLRVNTLKTTRDALIKRLEQKGVCCQVPDASPYAVHILGNYSLFDSEERKEGLFFVQDLASQTACLRLAPHPGETVLDLCSCPGGKSFHAAMLMNNQGSIRSMDLHPSKLSLVERGAKELAIDILSTQANDASQYREEWKDSADRIICDVPCSGLGVIAKKPDIRQKAQEEIQRLPLIQAAILQTASRYLKVGGTLLYSTCTLNPEENERITDSFLKNNKNFQRDERYPTPLTVFPQGGCIDGFFIDLLVRTE